jgi:transposase
VRVTTAFNKLLALDGASVTGVSFTPDGVVVEIRARCRRPVCPCGWRGRAIYDRSRRRWRHLDLGASKLFIEAEIRRLDCSVCGRVRTEDVPWARPAARHTRDFEDVVAWLVQRCDKTSVAALMRTSWATVARIVARVVVDHLDPPSRGGHGSTRLAQRCRYLTVVRITTELKRSCGPARP